MLTNGESLRQLIGWSLKDFSYRPTFFVCLNMINFQIQKEDTLDIRRLARVYFNNPHILNVKLVDSGVNKELVDMLEEGGVASTYDAHSSCSQFTLNFSDSSSIIIGFRSFNIVLF